MKKFNCIPVIGYEALQFDGTPESAMQIFQYCDFGVSAKKENGKTILTGYSINGSFIIAEKGDYFVLKPVYFMNDRGGMKYEWVIYKKEIFEKVFKIIE